ncbi:MAG TPA: CidA/LrgA family protein [Burkholderiaceae bacterium]
MQVLAGITWLLLFQAMGEAISRLLHLPIPGPVIGMLLLFAGLFAPAVRGAVAGCANFLLAHLGLLFVPAGVGVMTYLPQLQQYGLRLLAVIVLSTWFGLAVTACVLYALRDRRLDPNTH